MATPQVQNDQAVALFHPYIRGLNISIASTTVLAIAPGMCSDSNNVIDISVGFQNAQGNVYPATQFNGYRPGLFINCATTGANGLDAGSLANSTQYAVYLIADSRGYNQPAGLVSLTSNVSPLIPLGYDSYRLLGFVATDGSAHFVYATSKPQNLVNAVEYFISPASSALSGGNSTTFAAIDLTANSGIPTTTLQNIIVTLQVVYTPAAAGNYVRFRPTGSSATAGLNTIIGSAAGIAQTQYLRMIAGVGSSKPEIDYLVSSASDAVSVLVVAWNGCSNTAYPALV